MSLLTFIQDAADLLGLTQPSSVIGSTDLTTRQLYAIAVQEAKDLNRLWWKSMTREQTFITTATAAQAAALPDDFDRFWPNSFFNRTTSRPVAGPVSTQGWQLLQANPAAGRVVLGYNVRNGQFLLTPTPAAGETIAYEYISSNWARSSDLSTARARWTVDTDKTYFDEWLLTLGIIWRWRKSKGLVYAQDYDTYTDYRGDKIGNDGGSSVLSIADGYDYDPPLPSAPEGFSY